MKVPVVVMGLGEIGQQVVRSLADVRSLEIVGALDREPSRIGRSLSDIVPSATSDVPVTDRLDEVLALARGGVLLHATGSRLAPVGDEVESALRAGVHVVSTCEELAFPWIRHPSLAERLDAIATRAGVAVIGTGVNPGFVMDRLPVTLAQATGRVEHVFVKRTVDLARRRVSLQRKLGVGLTAEEFSERAAAGAVGHVGLMESAALVALGVGDSVDGVDEELSPLFADVPLRASWGPVEPGRVVGVRQLARAVAGGHEIARLELHFALGAPSPADEIQLTADPPLRLVVQGGVPGDSATGWNVVRTAHTLAGRNLTGLVTVLDLPIGA